MVVSLVADGRFRTYEITDPITVGEFLRLQSVDVQLNDLDDVNPPRFTQLSDGLRITVSRVREEFPCEAQEIPYQRETIINERLAPGQEQQGQRGRNGRAEVCYRVRLVDGVERERVQSGAPIIIDEPLNEIVFVGPTTTLDPVDIRGTLVYVSLNNAWVMRGNNNARRPLTSTSDLEPDRAFSLSSDGQRLLIARRTQTERRFENELWLIRDVGQIDPEPIRLTPANILSAQWVPGQPNVISYSLAEPRETEPFYTAKNDLWLMSIDPQTGTMIRTDPLIDGGVGFGGPFSWWGTRFKWSPDGQQLAWVHADAVGTVNLSTGELNPPLLQYTLFSFSILSDWSWRTSVSWSPDSSLLAATVHGPPIGSENPERSPVFNLAVAAVDGSFQVDLAQRVGIWSEPKFSPLINTGSQFPAGHLAYLVARQPLNSVSSEYDLYVADRDGSNARRVFPEQGRSGMTTPQYAWSPDGTQLVAVYQGNLWLIDVASAAARQLTLDGNASHPVWMP